MEGDPGRLAEVEERIELVRKLLRKYGDNVEQVIAFQDQAQRDLEALETSDERREAIEGGLATAYEGAGSHAWELSERRRRAAESLTAGTADELDEVGLGRVRFVATVRQELAADGIVAPGGVRYAFSEDGIDQGEFETETNRG